MQCISYSIRNIPGGTSEYNFIGGGRVNLIDGNTCYASIAGGREIRMSDTPYSVIGGGYQNCIMTTSASTYYSIIGGGYNNIIEDSCNNGIMAGKGNLISGPQTHHSFIGGGTSNSITGPADPTWNAVIGGGYNNQIQYGSTYAVIGGGLDNVVRGGCYSAILGGQNNNVSHGWASASGYNVTSVMDCAFHANNYVAQNMPSSSFGLPTGAFYYTCCAPGVCVVHIA